MILKDRANALGIADITAHELVARVLVQGSQVGGIPCIGKQVKVDERTICGAKRAQNEIRANKPGTACHENRVVEALSHDLQYMVQNKQDSSFKGINAALFTVFRFGKLTCRVDFSLY